MTTQRQRTPRRASCQRKRASEGQTENVVFVPGGVR